MPVRKVGPDSYQWGTSGKVYTGKDAKAKAERQGRAIYASGYREAEDTDAEIILMQAILPDGTVAQTSIDHVDHLHWPQDLLDEKVAKGGAMRGRFEGIEMPVGSGHHCLVWSDPDATEPNAEASRLAGQPVFGTAVVYSVYDSFFEAESYKPPASAVSNAKRGLALRKEYGRGGLSPSEAKSQGIDSGVTRARKIASGKVSRHDVRRMSAFNRHRKNYRPEKKMPDGGPTAGTIAWLLWGGTSGVNWAKKKSASMNAESEERQGDYMVPADIHRILESAVHLQQLQESHDGSYPEWWKSKLSVVASQLDNLTDVLDYKVDHPEEFDAEDYNSFTEEIQSLIDKYGVLQSYYTTFGDNIMDVSFSFQPHDPYFDQVDFDAEVQMKRDWLPEIYFFDQTKDQMDIGVEYEGKRYAGVLAEHHLDDESFDAEKPKNSRISPYAALAYLKSSPDACVWLLDWSTEPYAWNGDVPSFDYPVEDPDELEYMIIEGVFEGPDAPDIATDKYYRAENWGGDPEGPLAKALARAREKLSRSRKPLRITSLPHPDQKTLKDFESDNWKLLPRDRMGRWRKPVDSESINRLTESLSSDVPSISELLTMYGGDTPTNRFRLYQDLQTLSLAQMDAALPDDSIVEFDEADLSWMTPEEYYQYVLEEPLNLSDDIEDDTETVEFQDRLVRYTAMTMTPTEVDALLEQNLKDVVADLFAPDSEDTEAEIAFLLAVKRYQGFSDRYAAE